MNKIKIFIVTFLFTILFIFSFVVLVSPKCKKNNFLSSYDQLGLNVFRECFNEVDIKNNIKYLLKNNRILYNIASNIKVRFFKEFGKSRDIYQKVDFIPEDLKDNFEKVKDIKGIINNNSQLKYFSIKENNNEIDLKSWNRSQGNNWNTKFYDSNLINKQNIKNLHLAWSYNSIDKSKINKDWKSRIGINPIYADGIVYFVGADWQLHALDAEDGKLIWSLKFPFEVGKRGFLWHYDDNLNKSYILINAGQKVYKIDSKTGILEKKFGNSGSVYVYKANIPPVVYNDIIIISNIQKSKILGIDIYSGKIEFEKDIHPEEKIKLYSVPWGGAALDKKNGIYFIVTGNPKPDLKGINRPGDNKNANSVIAFDLDEKKIIWSFQAVKHDLWDLDLSAPPILADLKIKNFIIEIVIITTKAGNTLLFERKTGKPLFDINYKEAPKSNVLNEISAPKQIFIQIPERFSKIEFEKKDLRKNLIEDENFISNFEKKTVYSWFQPPTLGKETIIYGIVGGNNWIGSAYNPSSQILYVPSNHIPYKIKIFPVSIENDQNFLKDIDSYKLYSSKCASCHKNNRNGIYNVDYSGKETNFIPSLVGFNLFEPLKNKFVKYKEFKNQHANLVKISKKQFDQIRDLFLIWDKKLKEKEEIYFDAYFSKFLGPDDILASKPPWGTISAIDLVSGKIIWKIPYGYKNKKKVGTLNLGGISISSSNLIFANGTSDKYATVIDAENGEEIWKFKMKARGSAPPLIYEHKKKQYVSFLSTGGVKPGEEKDSTIYTFSLD